MAASNLENQLHSAQKNLLFLQREHANTLKGLHAEIRRLQQHCTAHFPGEETETKSEVTCPRS
uniref:Coiled-coil domain containing 92 n=1 Tax=Sarcophilus harrisii TaxID=9305 RepID=G3WVD6_SARHA